jgi:hypothetical protein
MTVAADVTYRLYPEPLSLSKNPKLNHPFPSSVLGQRLSHYKGKRKHEAN